MSGSASTWPSAHETELESEFEHELETEGEGEGILGTIGNVLGGLLGEGETTAASEFEGELEGEGEGIFGSIGNIVGGLLGEGEGEGEGEFEGEFEGEAFVGFLKKLGPILKRVAKVAAPMVGTAILGPAGGALGRLAASALGETEFETEFEHEGELETEFEGEMEAVHEIANHPLTEHEALAEMMAEAASHAASEHEAEAMAGAAVVTVLSPRDRRALSSLLPDLLRGSAVLTRILRRHRLTRPAIRAMPTIMRRTVRTLKRQVAAGRPVTRRTAARATAREVRRVLGSPRLVGASLGRNIRVSRAVKRSHRRRGGYRAVAG